MSVTLDVACLCGGVTGLGVVVTISLSVVVYKFVLYFINGPPRILAPYHSFPEVLQLLIEKL